MVLVPTPTPETSPAEFTVAIPGMLLLHEPVVAVSFISDGVPEQILVIPVIGPGVGFTVMLVVAELPPQPLVAVRVNVPELAAVLTNVAPEVGALNPPGPVHEYPVAPVALPESTIVPPAQREDGVPDAVTAVGVVFTVTDVPTGKQPDVV